MRGVLSLASGVRRLLPMTTRASAYPEPVGLLVEHRPYLASCAVQDEGDLGRDMDERREQGTWQPEGGGSDGERNDGSRTVELPHDDSP